MNPKELHPYVQEMLGIYSSSDPLPDKEYMLEKINDLYLELLETRAVADQNLYEGREDG